MVRIGRARRFAGHLGAIAFIAAIACAAPNPASPASCAGESPCAVFFGSSTTTGLSASDAEHRWTTLVAKRFALTEVNRGLNGSKLTERGDVVPSAEVRWRGDVVAADPDFVFIMYGANDIDNRVPLGTIDDAGTFRHAVHAVLTGVRDALPGARIIVLEPQPAVALATARIPYDSALADGAAEIGATLVRLGTAFPAGTYAADLMHLNDDGHAALASFVAETVIDAGLMVP